MKAAAVLALLLCAIGGAAAQNTAMPAVKRAATGQRTAPPMPSIPLPEELAPAQEMFAAFPESAAAAAAPAPSDCDGRLAKIASFRALPVLIGPGECGATDAVQLDAVILADGGRVAVAPAATLRCTMAEAIANWVREDVAAAALKLGAALRALDNVDSYECRGRNRVRGATLSEHGRANALDVHDFKLADGRVVALTDVNVDKQWRDDIRASVCARFSTVLGPGSDGEHEEHIHLDLAERRNNYKICEWDVREPPLQAQNAAPRADSNVTAAAPRHDTAELTPANPLADVPLPRPRPAAADAAMGKLRLRRPQNY